MSETTSLANPNSKELSLKELEGELNRLYVNLYESTRTEVSTEFSGYRDENTPKRKSFLEILTELERHGKGRNYTEVEFLVIGIVERVSRNTLEKIADGEYMIFLDNFGKYFLRFK